MLRKYSSSSTTFFDLLERYPEFKKFVEQLFEQNNCLKYGSHYVVTRCPVCGDSQKRLYNHGHFYFYPNGVAKCFRCNYTTSWNTGIYKIARRLNVVTPENIRNILFSGSILEQPNIEKDIVNLREGSQADIQKQKAIHRVLAGQNRLAEVLFELLDTSIYESRAYLETQIHKLDSPEYSEQLEYLSNRLQWINQLNDGQLKQFILDARILFSVEDYLSQLISSLRLTENEWLRIYIKKLEQHLKKTVYPKLETCKSVCFFGNVGNTLIQCRFFNCSSNSERIPKYYFIKLVEPSILKEIFLDEPNFLNASKLMRLDFYLTARNQEGNLDYLTISNLIKQASNIVLAEGVFDILNVFGYNEFVLNKSSRQASSVIRFPRGTVYLAVYGKTKFRSILKTLFRLNPRATYHILADIDTPVSYFKQIKQSVTFNLNKENCSREQINPIVYVYYPASSNPDNANNSNYEQPKDFGESLYVKHRYLL